MGDLMCPEDKWKCHGAAKSDDRPHEHLRFEAV
jgi:hypothetical protein